MANSSTLIDIQKEALLGMLNLNGTPTSATWKVLVYDNNGQSIISPILKVNDLRANGITVNINLYSPRQPIPDVPAIYFISPTEDNVARIGLDFAQNLYLEYYINFDSPVPRSILESLARTVKDLQQSNPQLNINVAQVYDQYLNFVCLDLNLFSLNFKDSYQTLNSPQSNDSQIDQVLNNITSSLFSVLVTMGVTPIIRCPRGNAAEMLAVKLDQKLRDHILNSRNSGTDTQNYSLSRPDRNLDLCSMICHAWTYSTMVHDLFDMKFNRLSVTTEDKKKKNYDLDPKDFFWLKHSGLPFPEVADDCSTEIQRYKKDVEELTNSCGVSSLDEVSDGTKNLALAITKMPELTERKRILDMHMNIVLALMAFVQERKLDSFFSLEETISKQTKSSLMDVFTDASRLPEDKIRLFLIYYLTSSDEVIARDGGVSEYEKVLLESGCTTDSINVLNFSRMAAASTIPASSSSGDIFGKISSMGAKFTDTLQTSGVTGGLDSFISGVKNLLPQKKDLLVSRAVDCFMEGSSVQEFDDYLLFDPKLNKGMKSFRGGSKQGGVNSFLEAIVFVVGGGNYFEYQNLIDYSQRNGQRKKITYGSTEIVTAKGFLDQLEVLGGLS